MKKRFLSILLTLCMVLSLLPTMALAVDDGGLVDTSHIVDIFLNGANSSYDIDEVKAEILQKLVGQTKTWSDGTTSVLTADNIRFVTNVTVLDPSNLKDWYVYDHYDTNWFADETAWEAGTNYSAPKSEGVYYTYGDTSALRPYFAVTENYASGRKTSILEQKNANTLTNLKQSSMLSEHIYGYLSNPETKAASMIFTGYGTPAYTDFLFYPTDNANDKEVTFKVNSANGNTHSMSGVGFLLNAGIDSNGYISGYVLYYALNGDSSSITGCSSVTLYKINDNVLASAFHGAGSFTGNATPVTSASVSAPTWSTGTTSIKLSISTTGVKVYHDASGGTSYTQIGNDATFTMAGNGSYGFGPLVQYSSHNCDATSYFTFDDLTMQIIQSADSILDSIYNSNYMQGTERYFINLVSADQDTAITADDGGLAVMSTNEIRYITDHANPFVGSGAPLGTNGATISPSSQANFTTQAATYILGQNPWTDTTITPTTPVASMELVASAANHAQAPTAAEDEVPVDIIKRHLEIGMTVYAKDLANSGRGTITGRSYTLTAPNGAETQVTAENAAGAYTPIFTVAANSAGGIYTVTQTVTYAGGSSSSINNFFEIQTDVTAPTPSAAAVNTDYFTSTITLTNTASPSGSTYTSDLYGYYYTVNKSNDRPSDPDLSQYTPYVSSSENVSLSSFITSSGTHYLHVFLRDEAGNVGYAVRSFAVTGFPVIYCNSDGDPIATELKIPGQKYYMRTSYAELDLPTGSALKGWTTTMGSSIVNYLPGGEYAIDGTITVYPVFATVYTLSFDLNDVANTSNPADPVSQPIAEGNYASAPATDPSSWTVGATTYYFDGWYTADSGGDRWNFAGNPINSNRTLYAHWSTVKTYTVAFDDNLSDVEDDYCYVASGNLSNQHLAATAYVTTPVLARVDYIFGGWYTDAACTNQFNSNNTLQNQNAAGLVGNNNTITLYAKWTAKYDNYSDVKVSTTALDGGTYAAYYSDYIDAYANDSNYGTLFATSVYRNFVLVNASGYRLSESSLPAGLHINSRTGEIYGVPQETGDFTFYVRMANDEGRWISETATITVTVARAGITVDMKDDNGGLSKIYGAADPDSSYGGFYPNDQLVVTVTGTNTVIPTTQGTSDYGVSLNYSNSDVLAIRSSNKATFDPSVDATLKFAPDLADTEDSFVPSAPSVQLYMDFHRVSGEDAGTYRLYMTDECIWVAGDSAPTGYTVTIADALYLGDDASFDESTDSLAPEYIFTINKLGSVSYTATTTYGGYKPGDDVSALTWTSGGTGLIQNDTIGVKDALTNLKIDAAAAKSTGGAVKTGTPTLIDPVITNSDNPLGTASADTTANYDTPSFILTIAAKPLTATAGTLSVRSGSTVTVPDLQKLVALDEVSGDKVGVTITKITVGEAAYSDLGAAAAALTELAKTSGETTVSVEYSALLAGDDADNYALAAAGTVTTAKLSVSSSSGGSGGGGGAAPSAPSGAVPVIVDGKTYNIGTATTSDDVTTVTVNQTELKKQLDEAEDAVIVPISSDTSTVVAELVVANIDEMAQKEMTLSVTVDDVSYDMRAVAIDTQAVMAELGATDATKVPINVTIKDLPSSAVTLENGTLVVPPVQFTVTASYGGKTVEVEVFEKYVQRVIEITEAQAKQITTAVVVENGTQRHVPTNVFQKDGKWYAQINSLTNSNYALINNEVSFTDDDGKWFEATVTEMASRGIINGRATGDFDGEASITRAEFAAILVRALGLPQDGDASGFEDVAETDWYYGAVGKAYEYGLVYGKDTSHFDPTANITRQEAMAMIHRASAITELSGTTSTLDKFSDADSVGTWALADAQWNVGTGLIQGNSAGMICGQDSITRGETATIILRLLQKSELVDVRTKA